MDKIIRFENVCDYNTYMGVETLNPLVNVLNFEDCNIRERKEPEFYSYNFYTVFLKDTICGKMVYGRSYYDYQKGTLVFIAPGQVYGVGESVPDFVPKGYALIFHPDLLRGTELAKKMKDYTFFSYEVREALHVSDEERDIVLDCLQKIKTELKHAIDKHSRTIIASNIELLLNYCTRFYDRQFIMRENVNHDILTKFEILLNDYLHSDKPKTIGLPSVAYCADKLNLSANYFGDLMKKETGRTAQEHIQLKLINAAKDRIMDTDKSINEIAYELGFQYPQHFSRMFKKQTGFSPNKYRSIS